MIFSDTKKIQYLFVLLFVASFSNFVIALDNSESMNKIIDMSVQQFGAFSITLILCIIIITSLIYIIRVFWSDRNARELDLTNKLEKLSLATMDALIKNAEAMTKLSEKIEHIYNR